MSLLEVDIRYERGRAPTLSVELDGVPVLLTLRWMPRIGRTFFEVRNPAGELLTQPGLAAPGAPVPFDPVRTDSPPGLLTWAGPDPYAREDLRLTYREAEPAPERRTWRQIRAATTRGGVTFDSTEVTFDNTSITFDVVNGT